MLVVEILSSARSLAISCWAARRSLGGSRRRASLSSLGLGAVLTP